MGKENKTSLAKKIGIGILSVTSACLIYGAGKNISEYFDTLKVGKWYMDKASFGSMRSKCIEINKELFLISRNIQEDKVMSLIHGKYGEKKGLEYTFETRCKE